MRINPVSNSINCKANFFTVERVGKKFDLYNISTDNEENLGKEPVLEYYYSSPTSDYKETGKFPMQFDGKYYTARILGHNIDLYRIYYKDTGKYEKNGEAQHLNPLNFILPAIREDRTFNKLPLEESIVKGKTEGQIVVNSDIIPQDVPVILVMDEVAEFNDFLVEIPDNVKGIICFNQDKYELEHETNLLRNQLPLISSFFDKEKFEDIKKLNGKYLALDNEDGSLKYKEIVPKLNLTDKIAQEKVVVPKLDNVERLLNFDELTPQNCGNKGYRLGVMQKLVKEGSLKDITIPNGFVIPEGYINKLKEYINYKNSSQADWDKLENGFFTQEVEEKVKNMGMDRTKLIARSNFNTEDLDTFSSAGIYNSLCVHDANILDIMLLIINSEEISDLMDGDFEVDRINQIRNEIHKKYGIEDSQIQPSVIIQEYIRAVNYNFTVYSDDGDNNILIELLDTKLGYANPGNSIIRYNKSTKELTLERSQSPRARYVLNEEGNIIEKDYGEDRTKNAWSTLTPLLGIITAGALTLEKFFKHAQDIEGGIKNGKVYFWQTRDIVAKAVKRI